MRKLILLVMTMLFGCSEPEPEDKFDIFEEMEYAENSSRLLATEKYLKFMSFSDIYQSESLQDLARASAQGHLNRVHKLLESGVKVDEEGRLGATALYWSAREENLEGFSALLSAGANPNIVFDDGSSIIHLVTRIEEQGFLKEAIRNGGNPNLGHDIGIAPPIFQALAPTTKNNLDILLNAGADYDAANLEGNTPLMVAAAYGQFDVVYKLLNRGADFQHVSPSGASLVSYIERRARTMDPENELYDWMTLVIQRLEDQGAIINVDVSP